MIVTVAGVASEAGYAYSSGTPDATLQLGLSTRHPFWRVHIASVYFFVIFISDEGSIMIFSYLLIAAI